MMSVALATIASAAWALGLGHVADAFTSFPIIVSPIIVASRNGPRSSTFLSSSAPKDVEHLDTMDEIEGVSNLSDKSLLDLIGFTSYGSRMIYDVAGLRKIVKTHSYRVRQELYNGQPARKKLLGKIELPVEEKVVKFSGAETIIRQLAEQGTIEDERIGNDCRFLPDPITAEGVATFVEQNIDLIGVDSGGDFVLRSEKRKTTEPKIVLALRRIQDTDIKIVAFDDYFQSSELIYAIAINDTKKRISLVFRGSVFGNKDWSTNLNFKLRSVNDLMAGKQSQFITKEDANKVSSVGVHSGFVNYLLGTAPKLKNEQSATYNSKFDKIVSTIQTIYEEKDGKGKLKYADYQFCISGHSLGGALAQLMAFSFGSSKKCLEIVPKPILAVTYASPCVGNEAYSDAMLKLEEKGILRHLRFTNEGDLVPVFFSLFAGYTHEGSNFHLKERDIMDVKGFANSTSFVSQLNTDPLACHMMKSYQDRLFYKVDDINVNSRIWRLKFAKIYDYLARGDDVLSIPVPYQDMTVRELRSELESRGLDVSGKRKDLIERLKANDKVTMKTP